MQPRRGGCTPAAPHRLKRRPGDNSHSPVRGLDSGELQTVQVREQHPQQLGLVRLHLVQHNGPPGGCLLVFE